MYKRQWRQSATAPHTCHTNPARDAEGATPATKKAAASKRHASASIYAGTESATRATQIQPEMLKVTRLPRQKAAASKPSILFFLSMLGVGQGHGDSNAASHLLAGHTVSCRRGEIFHFTINEGNPAKLQRM